MKKLLKGNFISSTNIGRIRTTNEDSAIAVINNSGDVLLCVCDGMGGYKKGDYASQILCETLKSEFLKKKGFITKFSAIKWASDIIDNVNKKIYKKAQANDYENMGTTIVLCMIVKNSLIVIWAGDSRCYFYNYEKLEQVSEDQTYSNYLYNINEITKEELEVHEDKHILTNAIGAFPNCNLCIKTFSYEDQGILLCSDGLYNNLSGKDILSCLSSNENLNLKVNTLFAFANSNGGSDNMAVAIWEPIK